MIGRTRPAWLDRHVTLGLCAYTHDSAAGLIVDGELVGFVEEERLSGIKHTRDYPRQAVDWLLDSQQMQPGDVTDVCYNFQPQRYLDSLRQLPEQLRSQPTRARAAARAGSFVRVAARTRSRLHRLGARFPRARVHAIRHHRAHGLYAFASSGYDEAAVLVVDSLGEVETTTIGHARRDPASLRIIDSVADPASLGYVYGAVTEHLGWRRGDEEGTVMALAALGDPDRFAEVFAQAIPVTDDGFAVDSAWFPLRVLSSRSLRIGLRFVAATCPPRAAGEPIDQAHRDLAAALQQRTEQVMVALAVRARALTGSRLLCLGGGVAANCVAAAKIVETGLFDEVHIPPAPGDSGTAIGAAVETELARTGTLPTGIGQRCYLGPDYPALELPLTPRPGLRAESVKDPARLVAEQLAAGRVVGIFHGRVEAGPRALGNRSILASPLHPEVVDRLNATVKYREPFRPFAPVVLAGEAEKYFTLTQPAPFMSFASGVTDLARAAVGAIVHANDTARLQTVDARANPLLSAILTEFASLTGVPVLINTSLNVKGSPICGTPEMALDCLLGSGLDALMMQGWWVTKC
ncbi:carbamoyltransferase family protein [Nocardia takedensis]|uniref:carbamoyltransferase family protein n=1 Tax=Nocardia takedensis TaxID=259390 RepID=UPI00030772DA|nr:carbamoyltransferase C-terminal domain-containing protein [Nocardia takedensis]